jgi:signal transduction histidine kinase
MMSLRTKVLLVVVFAVIVTTLATSATTYYWARREIDTLFDYQLRQHALAISNRIYGRFLGDGIDPQPDQDLMVQIWDVRGGLVYYSHSRLTLPRASELGYENEQVEGDTWRVYSMAVGPRVVQVAQPVRVRRQLAAAAALRIVYPALGSALPLSVFLWWLIGRVMDPMRRVASAIRGRAPRSLVPIDSADLPEELRMVVNALNDLIVRVNKVLDEQRAFVSDAAHELRTPLTAIQLQMQLLKRAESPVEAEAELDQLDAGVDRMAHLVERLLTLARLDPEGIDRAFEACNLAELARSALDQCAVQAQAKAIDVELKSSDDAVMRGHPPSLEALLVNLVDNAVRYTPAHGKVAIEVARSPREIELQVTDTGPGIPPGERERVFDRFYRVAGTDAPGSGLGLAIVKRIVELHHGRIALSDGAAGRGLKVSVWFPATPT